jgi:hypothetical protein
MSQEQKSQSSYEPVPAVTVKSDDKDGGEMLVNVTDFDPAKHELIGVPEHPDVLAKMKAHAESIRVSRIDDGKKDAGQGQGQKESGKDSGKGK